MMQLHAIKMGLGTCAVLMNWAADNASTRWRQPTPARTLDAKADRAFPGIATAKRPAFDHYLPFPLTVVDQH